MPIEPRPLPTQVSDNYREDSQNAPESQEEPVPVWLQRLSLFVFVALCIYMGVLVLILPWWPRVWDQSPLMLQHPALSQFAHKGLVRGIVSGVGLLDIWIGISEAVNYRERRA